MAIIITKGSGLRIDTDKIKPVVHNPDILKTNSIRKRRITSVPHLHIWVRKTGVYCLDYKVETSTFDTTLDQVFLKTTRTPSGFLDWFSFYRQPRLLITNERNQLGRLVMVELRGDINFVENI